MAFCLRNDCLTPFTEKAAKAPAGNQIDENKQNSVNDERPHEREEEREYYYEEDGPWYFGKAKEEFNRRRDNQALQGRRAEEEDPIQVRILHNFTSLAFVRD